MKDMIYGATPNNIIDFSQYQQMQEMDVRRYVLTPVNEFATVAQPRPRRNHRNYGRIMFFDACFNLTIVAITLLLTIQLLAVV